MSLLDALLLEGYRDPGEVWLALRADGQRGSGTIDDPYDVSVRPGAELGGSLSLDSLLVVATSQVDITADPYNYTNESHVVIAGVTGAGAGFLNDTPDHPFIIEVLNRFQFQFTIAPGLSDGPGAADTITCQRVGDDQPVLRVSLSWVVRVTTDKAHHFNDYDFVQINGVAEDRFNGGFLISNTKLNSFQFQYLVGAPLSTGAGLACRCSRPVYLFDHRLSEVPENSVIHLGPGVLETQGYSPVRSTWFLKSGQRLLGSGMGATTLKLVNAPLFSGLAEAIIGDLRRDLFTRGGEVADLTVDCNLGGQGGQPALDGHPHPAIACAALEVDGTEIRLRRIRAINFGTQRADAECFVLLSGGVRPGLEQAFGFEYVNNVIEDCIIEQPSENNDRETTCVFFWGSDGLNPGGQGYNRACVTRNCYVNTEYANGTVAAVESYELNDAILTLTTKTPHRHVSYKNLVLAGAAEAEFNGLFPIHQILSDRILSCTLPSAPSSGPTGNLVIGGTVSSLPLAIKSCSVEIKPDDSSWQVTLETGRPQAADPGVLEAAPHYRTPGNTVRVLSMKFRPPLSEEGKVQPLQNSTVLNGVFKVCEVVPGSSGTKLRYIVTKQPESDEISCDEATVGIFFQAIGLGVCAAQVVASNRIYQAHVGSYTDTGSTKELIVRDNYYYNVPLGPEVFLSRHLPRAEGSGLTRAVILGQISAIFQTIAPHPYQTMTNHVKIRGAVVPRENPGEDPYANAFNNSGDGFTVTPIDPYHFSYPLASDPRVNAGGSPVFGEVLEAATLTHEAKRATFTTMEAHFLQAGDLVSVFGARVNGSYVNPFNGVFRVLSASLGGLSFDYAMASDPGGNPEIPPAPMCAKQVATPLVHLGLTATFTPLPPHDFYIGQGLDISGAEVNGSLANAYNGRFQIIAVTPSSVTYLLKAAQAPAANASGTPGCTWFDQTRFVVVEHNLIELAASQRNSPSIGFLLLTEPTRVGPYVFRRTLFRNNVIGHASGVVDKVAVSLAAASLETALIEGNVAALDRDAVPGLTSFSYALAGHVRFFQNQKPSGQRVPSIDRATIVHDDETTAQKTPELEDEIQDAILLALL